MRRLNDARADEHLLAVPYQEAMALLLRAAAAGHLEAQAKYGMTRFNNMFQAQAPEPDERDEYIKALSYLFIAGRRGHERAGSHLPGITADSFTLRPGLS